MYCREIDVYTTALSPCFMIQYSYEKNGVSLDERSRREREKERKRNDWDWWKEKKNIYWRSETKREREKKQSSIDVQMIIHLAVSLSTKIFSYLKTRNLVFFSSIVTSSFKWFLYRLNQCSIRDTLEKIRILFMPFN